MSVGLGKKQPVVGKKWKIGGEKNPWISGTRQRRGVAIVTFVDLNKLADVFPIFKGMLRIRNNSRNNYRNNELTVVIIPYCSSRNN